MVATLAAALPAAAFDNTGFHSAWVGQDSWPTLAPGMTVSYSLRFRTTGTTAWQRGILGKQVWRPVLHDEQRNGRPRPTHHRDPALTRSPTPP